MPKFVHNHFFLSALGTAALFLCVPAATVWAEIPFGLVAEYGEQDPEDANFHNENYLHLATHKMLTDTPITYAIKFDDYPGRTPQTDEQWLQKTDALIRAAFNRWPKSVAKTIRSARRAKEFKDVLDTLNQHPLIFQRVSEEEADILFYFDEHKSADFLYNKEDLSKQKTIRMKHPALEKDQLKNLPHFLAHEIGHYYGLGDRYQEGISGSSPLYSTTEGTDSKALMAKADKPDLTKDDVDGFINLMDVTQAFAARKFNARAEKGWVSFDSENRMFARGKELGRAAFFDGNTIYYYNQDGSIKSRREAKTVGTYNPLAEKRAQQGPFEGVQRVVSDTTDIETSFDYTHLGVGRLQGRSVVANLTMLTFTARRLTPQKWNLQLNYERTINGYTDKNKQVFTIQVQPETCRIYIDQYYRSMQNVQVEINPATGQFSFQGKATDLSDNKAPYTIQAGGTEQDAQFTYTHGENSYRMFWKNGSFYNNAEQEQPGFDDHVFFVADHISWVRKLLSDELHFCKYFSTLSKQQPQQLRIAINDSFLKNVTIK